MSLHQPIRPDWICAACNTPWPCPTRQRQLAAHYDGAYISLVVYLTGFFLEACQDLHRWPAGMLYTRFIAWPAAYPRRARGHGQPKDTNTDVRALTPHHSQRLTTENRDGLPITPYRTPTDHHVACDLRWSKNALQEYQGARLRRTHAHALQPYRPRAHAPTQQGAQRAKATTTRARP